MQNRNESASEIDRWIADHLPTRTETRIRQSEIDIARVKLRDALARRARAEACRGIFRCTICKESYVDPVIGEDTCSDCLKGRA